MGYNLVRFFADDRSAQTMRALLPAGKEPPPPLGGLAVSEQNSDLSSRRPERVLGSRSATLMQCCCTMLTSSYPVMVSSKYLFSFWMKIVNSSFVVDMEDDSIYSHVKMLGSCSYTWFSSPCSKSAIGRWFLVAVLIFFHDHSETRIYLFRNPASAVALSGNSPSCC